MTLAEIKELISKKIAGQGTQVDLGGALAKVLTGIAEAVEAATPKVLEIKPAYSFSNKTKAETEEILGITGAEIDALLRGEYSTIKWDVGTVGESIIQTFGFAYCTADVEGYVLYGMPAGEFGYGFQFGYNSDGYYLDFYEA